MGRVLIVYSSTHGQTQKIAESMAEEIRSWGHGTYVLDGNVITNDVNPAAFDAVIVGASVHMGRYSKNLQKWVKAYAQALTAMPSAFFSVCLGILQKDSVVQQTEQRIVDDFFRTTHWQPDQKTIFAGALKYSRYGFLMKWLMKRIARKAGVETDTHQDYDYTDWQQVRLFARRFSHAAVKNEKL